jgi:hypothetical protein
MQGPEGEALTIRRHAGSRTGPGHIGCSRLRGRLFVSPRFSLTQLEKIGKQAVSALPSKRRILNTIRRILRLNPDYRSRAFRFADTVLQVDPRSLSAEQHKTVLSLTNEVLERFEDVLAHEAGPTDYRPLTYSIRRLNEARDWISRADDAQRNSNEARQRAQKQRFVDALKKLDDDLSDARTKNVRPA